MVEEQKPRRRIVPIAITSPQTSPNKGASNALNAPINVNLKEQAEKGRALGPGRKIYVNLAPYQTERKQVNFKRLLDEQAAANGAENERGAGADGALRQSEDGDPADPNQPRVQKRDAYLSIITRAAAVMNGINDSSDSDDGYDPEPMEADAEVDGDDDGSDEENENENERDGDVNAEVNLEEAEGAGRDGGDANATASGPGRAKGSNEDKDKDDGGTPSGAEPAPKKKKITRGNQYDYLDDWIDDSEFIQIQEITDRRKGKERGFVIYRGKIERDEADNEAGYEYDEETGTKKKRKRGSSKASTKKKDAGGKVDGDTPSGKSAKAKKEAPPYELPDEVREALDRVEAVVKEMPETNASSQKRKLLPKAVREELLRCEPVFKPEIDKAGIPAQKAIVDQLMQWVSPFTSRQNINAYVTGRMGGTQKQELVFSADTVKEIVKDLKPVDEKAADKPVFASPDAYLMHIPLAILSKVAKQIRLGLQGEALKSDRASVVLDEVLGCFPEGTMVLASLLKLVPEVEELEKKAEEESKHAQKRVKDQEKGMKAVEDMGQQVNDLDVDTAVEKGVAHGADETALRALLESEEAREDENWSCALKLLAVAGPYGLKVKFIGTTGQSSGLLKKGRDLHIRTVASKITKLFNEKTTYVGKIKDSNGFYALRLFPGNSFDAPLRKPQEEADEQQQEEGGAAPDDDKGQQQKEGAAPDEDDITVDLESE